MPQRFRVPMSKKHPILFLNVLLKPHGFESVSCLGFAEAKTDAVGFFPIHE